MPFSPHATFYSIINELATPSSKAWDRAVAELKCPSPCLRRGWPSCTALNSLLQADGPPAPRALWQQAQELLLVKPVTFLCFPVLIRSLLFTKLVCVCTLASYAYVRLCTHSESLQTCLYMWGNHRAGKQGAARHPRNSGTGHADP